MSGRIFTALAGKAARLLFPDRCVLCCAGGIDGWFCNRCADLLPRNGCACRRCAQPLEFATEMLLCAGCLTAPPAFAASRAALKYEFPVDSALKSLKFNRRLYLVPAFSSLLLHELECHFADTDALLPVPLHRRRQAARGFNQAQELCRPLARATGLPLLRNVHRVRATRPQSGLDARARRRNLSHAFAVRGALCCRRPLIVDDIMTTGETCNQLAQLLLRNGASSVGVLVVARA